MKNLLLNIDLAVSPLAILSTLFFLAGCLLLALWFASGPIASLAKTRIRHNRIPYYTPFVLIFLWLIAVAFVSGQLKHFYGNENAEGPTFIDYIAITAVEIAMITVILCLARKKFARGLRGFGLDMTTAFKDLFSAIVNYITVFPLVFVGLLVIVWIGQMIKGEDFLMQQNQGLNILLESTMSQKYFLVISFIVIVPIFEEILFRGILQSVLRQYVAKAWVAIIAASIIFSLLHPPMHWPALFFLSCCMGYAYEKSGSLIRPIIIHAIFNAINIAGALLA